jgi:hypothetical protein
MGTQSWHLAAVTEHALPQLLGPNPAFCFLSCRPYRPPGECEGVEAPYSNPSMIAPGVGKGQPCCLSTAEILRWNVWAPGRRNCGGWRHRPTSHLPAPIAFGLRANARAQQAANFLLDPDVGLGWGWRAGVGRR